jgi:hypothetical protein
MKPHNDDKSARITGQSVPADECSWGRTNYHANEWTARQADRTRAVQFGRTNRLALRVTQNTKDP